MTDTATGSSVATAPHDRTVPHGAAQAALTLVRVRYFAGARAAAGVAEEDVRLPAATVRSVLSAVRERRGPELDRVLARCSFLLNGVAVHDHATGIPDRAELDVLPPFAGG